MNVTTYTDAREFQARAFPLLLEHEAENNLMLGIAQRLTDATSTDVSGSMAAPHFWGVEDRGKAVAAAVWTPPFRLALTRGDDAAVDALCEHILDEGIHHPPGALGPTGPARRFGLRWCGRSGAQLKHRSDMGVYQLDRVQPPPNIPGQMQIARLDQLELLMEWHAGFTRDVNLDNPPEREIIRRGIEAGIYRFWWREGKPVSMASAKGATPHGIRISGVYTPPEDRRHGYATALVAALSQRQLDEGRKFCFLFTDLANPTSNGVYQRIGYRQVSTFGEYDFAAM